MQTHCAGDGAPGAGFGWCAGSDRDRAGCSCSVVKLATAALVIAASVGLSGCAAIPVAGWTAIGAAAGACAAACPGFIGLERDAFDWFFEGIPDTPQTPPPNAATAGK